MFLGRILFWWIYCGIKHAQRASSVFPEWISCIVVYLPQILLLSALTATTVISDLLGWGLGFLPTHSDFLAVWVTARKSFETKPLPLICVSGTVREMLILPEKEMFWYLYWVLYHFTTLTCILIVSQKSGSKDHDRELGAPQPSLGSVLYSVALL